MGADQNLIKAAAQMGPKPFDYSGILNAIRAIGQFANRKNAIADELVTYGVKNFEINELPPELFTGPYGEQNMAFITNSKDEYFKAAEIMGKSPSRSKRYKDAAKKINVIKSVLEKNKADAGVWVSMQGENAHKYWKNRSKGISFEAENRLADIVMNPFTGVINSNLLMTPQGLMVQQPSAGGNDPLADPATIYKPGDPVDVRPGGKRYITMSPDPEFDDLGTDVFNVSDLMQGYKENLAYKKIKLDDGSTLNIAEEIDEIVLKYGKNAKLAGIPEFEELLIKNDLTLLFEKIKQLGPDGLRSTAYDYTSTYFDENGNVKTQTFVEQTGTKLMGYNDKEWAELIEKNASNYDPIFETASPTASVAAEMKKQILTMGFSTNNYDVMETELMDWVTNLSKSQYKDTDMVDDVNSIVIATNKRIYKNKFNDYVEIMSGKTDDKTRTVNLGGDTFRYVKQTRDYKDLESGIVYKLKGKMAWEYNYNKVYEPIPERAGGSAGSGRALYSLLNNRPEFAFLLEEQYNSKVELKE